jgi:GxxExxY protein
MSENEISYILRGVIFKVYNSLGPGLFESVYVALLKHELERAGLKVESQFPIQVYYDNEIIDIGFRADLLIENKVIVEVKSVENIAPVHHKQLLTYLKLSDMKLGILVNFNSDNVANSIYRKVNGL